MSVKYVDFKKRKSIPKEEWKDVRIWDTLTLAQKYRVMRKRIELKSRKLREEERT